MLKVSEVHEKQIRQTNERPDGSEFVSFTTEFATREILINKDYVVAVQPYVFTSSLDQDKIEKSFPQDTKFSLLVVDGNSFRRSEIIVLGSFDKFCRLLQENKS